MSSEDTVERFRTSVDMKRNHVANNWAKHYVGIIVCAKCAFYLTLRMCDRSTRTFCLKQPNVKYVNDPQRTYQKTQKIFQHDD